MYGGIVFIVITVFIPLNGVQIKNIGKPTAHCDGV